MGTRPHRRRGAFSVRGFLELNNRGTGYATVTDTPFRDLEVGEDVVVEVTQVSNNNTALAAGFLIRHV